MRQPRGFTLVEIMIVIATIGLLSSVALPTFRTYQLRSKAAERGVITRQIENALTDYYAREGRYPQDWGGGMTGVSLWANPPGSITTSKRVFVQTWGDWRRLSLLIDGAVYFQYDGWAQDSAGLRWQGVGAGSDLDGDGDQPYFQRWVAYQSGRVLAISEHTWCIAGMDRCGTVF